MWAVPYVGSASPGRVPTGSWLNGANCQLFAYGVLGLFGIDCPPLPSSRLWEDRDTTVVVHQPQPLDLALFNAREDPFGAHLGLWMAPDEVVHLCKEVGHPVVWPLEEFARRTRYAAIVGYKRVTRRSAPTSGASAPAGVRGQRRPNPATTYETERRADR
jgi:hypothetical protein